MKRMSFVSTCIIFVIFAVCAHAPASAEFKTPITLSDEKIKSNGSVIQQPFSKEKTALLDKQLEKILIATGAKGISASVAVPDKGMWSSARGSTGNKTNEKITPEMKLCAGSIGKIFTAVVILSLIEDGRLSLDDSADKWFPEVSWAGKVTINHLLGHTSGIAGFGSAKEYESHKYLYRNPEELLSYLTKKKLLFAPGKHFAYSNTGYLMLGIIIERVTGRSYREAVERYIINKINLRKTEVVTSESIGGLVVKGHHQGNVLSEPDDYVVPFAAGSIAATPSDMVMFLQALMGGKLLPQGSLQKMFSDMNLMSRTQSTYYGKGIVAALNTPAGDIIGHTGGIKGFGASLFYHPEKNIFICVMMNDDARAVDPAMFKLLEAMID